MKDPKTDKAYIWDMLDAANAISEFISDSTIKKYLESRMLRNAIERNIEIIGEAAGRVSKKYCELHPEIPWRKIIAQRNVIIHEYGEIKQELLWEVASKHILELIPKLEELLH